MIKVVGIIKFLSVVFFLAVLTWVYSYLPVNVNLLPDSIEWQIDREYFFYSILITFIVLNVILSVLLSVLKSRTRNWQATTQAWLRAMTPALNIYITLIVGFVGIINNSSHVAASSFTYLNYLAPLIFIVWVIGFVSSYLKFERLSL